MAIIRVKAGAGREVPFPLSFQSEPRIKDGRLHDDGTEILVEQSDHMVQRGLANGDLELIADPAPAKARKE